jgi:hypothetical protein
VDTGFQTFVAGRLARLHETLDFVPFALGTYKETPY